MLNRCRNQFLAMQQVDWAQVNGCSLPEAVIEASQVNGSIAEVSGHWDMYTRRHLI